MSLKPEQRQDPGEDIDGKYRRDHPKTSRDAAYRAKQRSGTQREKVLLFLESRYPDGFTDEELQDMIGMAANTQRPRRVELVEMEWVEDSGEIRKTRSGLDAIVWRYRKVKK